MAVSLHSNHVSAMTCSNTHTYAMSCREGTVWNKEIQALHMQRTQISLECFQVTAYAENFLYISLDPHKVYLAIMYY